MAQNPFFTKFILRNGFVYNRNLTENENLDALVEKLNLCEKGAETMRRNFLKSPRREVFTPYILHNGFKYNYSLSEDQNFNLLVKQMKISGKGLDSLRRKFHSSKPNRAPEINSREEVVKKEKLEPEDQKFSRDLENVSQIGQITEFFDYFLRKYPFLRTSFSEVNFSNYFSAFQSLKNKLGWKNVYSNKIKYKKSLDNVALNQYLDVNLRLQNVAFQQNESHESKFKKLAEKLLWINYIEKFTVKFNQLVGQEAEYLSRNLENLQKIIENYNLLPTSETPDKINQCKEIIKSKLFANIYDFISGNWRKFDTLRELSAYTQKNKMFFPLSQAKESFIYKVLLQKLIFSKNR